jgi:hypothetical protein
MYHNYVVKGLVRFKMFTHEQSKRRSAAKTAAKAVVSCRLHHHATHACLQYVCPSLTLCLIATN